MAKPIVLVSLNRHANVQHVQEVSNMISEKLTDYHVIVTLTRFLEETKFEVFYEKDFTDIKYQELKSIIEKATLNKAENG